MANAELALALDVPTLQEALDLSQRVGNAVSMLKVGLELFVAEGPRALVALRSHPIFLDLKIHDIPETVERAVARACEHGVRVLTVHASGGAAMLERAVLRAAKENTQLEIAAVTLLTSLDDADAHSLGFVRSASAQALHLASLATSVGVTSLVCSAWEIEAVRRSVPRATRLYVPGIRARGATQDDQKRVRSARDAAHAGANVLVVGRPIRDAVDVRAAALAITAEISGEA